MCSGIWREGVRALRRSCGWVVCGPLSPCFGACFKAIEFGEEVLDVRGKLRVGNILRGPSECLADASEKVDILDPGSVFRLVHLHT
jgi:hypothetical protein